MKEQSYSGFRLACQRNNVAMVTKFLKNSTKEVDMIDVLHDNGVFFNIAMSHDNSSLLKMLLDYMYNTKQIESDPKNNNVDQSIKYTKLQKILRESKKEFSVSEDIDNLISNICQENDEDSQDNLSDAEATTGNDYILWDDFIHGNNKSSNKYSEKYKNITMSVLQNNIPKHSSMAKAIIATQEELSDHSNTQHIPSPSALRYWIKHKPKIEQSNLTLENLRKLPTIDYSKKLDDALQKQEDKLPYNTEEDKFNTSPLFTSTDNINQPTELKIVGESNTFDVHDTTDSI